MTSPSSRDAEDLGRRGHSGQTLRRLVLKHRRHPSVPCRPRDCSRIGSRLHELAHVVGNREDLEDAGAAAAARPIATLASFGLVHAITHLQTKHRVARVIGDFLGGELPFNLATFAEDTDQALRNSPRVAWTATRNSRPEIEQTRYRGGRRFGVQRGEHQMARSVRHE